MKRFLNTLFVTTQGAYLRKDGETVAVKVDREVRLRVPIITISGIVCFGDVGVSPFLLGYCAQNGVSISFLSVYGRFLARVQGPVAGNVLLRKEQYRMSDDQMRSARVALGIVAAKISNSRMVLLRALRDHGEKLLSDKVASAADRLKESLEHVQVANDLDTIRGIEGDSARIYFDVFNELIVAQRSDFSFADRNRRPPLDRVNALLSFAYTLLYHDMRSALEVTGLDPAVGFLHRDRPGRLSLALDLMEESRAFFADRLVLSLINLKQIDGKMFTVSPSGAVLMNDAGKKILLTAYQKRKQDSLQHPFLNEEMHIGILFQTQALLMARFIRGDIDGYPPFFWR